MAPLRPTRRWPPSGRRRSTARGSVVDRGDQRRLEQSRPHAGAAVTAHHQPDHLDQTGRADEMLDGPAAQFDDAGFDARHRGAPPIGDVLDGGPGHDVAPMPRSRGHTRRDRAPVSDELAHHRVVFAEPRRWPRGPQWFAVHEDPTTGHTQGAVHPRRWRDLCKEFAMGELFRRECLGHGQYPGRRYSCCGEYLSHSAAVRVRSGGVSSSLSRCGAACGPRVGEARVGEQVGASGEPHSVSNCSCRLAAMLSGPSAASKVPDGRRWRFDRPSAAARRRDEVVGDRPAHRRDDAPAWTRRGAALAGRGAAGEAAVTASAAAGRRPCRRPGSRPAAGRSPAYR
jgi:hypothetical protein